MNKVILSGRVVNDDFKLFESEKGTSLTFKVALIEKSKNTNFVEIVCFNKIAMNISKYIKKGDLLEIEGKLNNSKYIDKNDETIYKTEIVAKNITFSVKAKKNKNLINNEIENEENNDFNEFGFKTIQDE
ncbi:single-stranded DNA-binding protein [Mycoplasmopsis adleri]|uniref:single-stranded DNA-binding protein n=1 Tax=Mycoplasmopsis adleri TaxID=51362 RepID=UPI0038739B60